MLFSIVIPLYNKHGYVLQTLETVLAQSLGDFEIIVVDDGSTDGSADLIERRLSDPRLTVLRQANAGVSAARNHGIGQARGEWIAFLDADDCWHPSYLACLSRLIMEHPSIDMVAAKLRFIPDGPNWSPLPWTQYDRTMAAELIHDLPGRWMRSIPFSTSAVAVRASLLKSMQPCFRVGESNGEDLDLWFRLNERTPIAWMPQELMAYRAATPGSLTSAHRARQEPPYIARMAQRARDGSMPLAKQQAALKYVADLRLTLARLAHASGARGEAFKWLWTSQGHRYTRRWYVTLFMLTCLPGSWAQRWESWRIQRAHSAQP